MVFARHSQRTFRNLPWPVTSPPGAACSVLCMWDRPLPPVPDTLILSERCNLSSTHEILCALRAYLCVPGAAAGLLF